MAVSVAGVYPPTPPTPSVGARVEGREKWTQSAAEATVRGIWGTHRHRDHINTLAQDPISEISKKGLGSDLVDG